MATGKAKTEFTILVLLLVLGIGLRIAPVALLAFPIAIHLLGAHLLAAGGHRPRLVARRTLSAARVWEGQTVEIHTTVENHGSRVELLHVRGSLPLGLDLVDGTLDQVTNLGAKEVVSLQCRARARRGLYFFPGVRLAAQDFLGYMAWEDELPCPARLVALPRFERLVGVAIAPRRTLPQAGTAHSGRGGSGIEFFGAREYRPGDEIRRINWKALARLNELVVVEFEEERVADVAVVLDVRQEAYRGEGGQDLLDLAARGAAGLCQAFLAHGHRVGLLMYGTYLDWTYPGYGRRHGERLLGELARAQPGRSEVFAELRHLPTRLLRPGSVVALVSPLLPGDSEDLGMLAARGYHVLTLVPDPATVPAEGLGGEPEVALALRILQLERRGMVARLHAAGARPVVWDARYPLTPQARAGWRRAR